MLFIIYVEMLRIIKRNTLIQILLYLYNKYQLKIYVENKKISWTTYVFYTRKRK